MADLLATVDDMAEDLRKELDRAVQEAVVGEVAGEDEAAGLTVELEAADVAPSLLHEITTVKPAETDGTISQRDLIDEVRQTIQALSKPASLASIAHSLQSTFGPEITQNWTGYGTFKNLLKSAVPDLQLIDAGPGYVLPSAVTSKQLALLDTQGLSDTGEGVPSLVQQLRRLDRSVPAVSGSQMEALTCALAYSLSIGAWEDLGLLDKNGSSSLGIREVNVLTRSARDWIRILRFRGVRSVSYR